MASDRFVSRGGDKLQFAIENWKLKIENFTCLDVGSSTGGFVDCLLQNGAAKVYAVDTSYGELAWKLRNDPKVVVMERTNILHLEKLPFPPVILNDSEGSLADASTSNKLRDSSATPQNDKVLVDLITIDAGWTKLELVLPVIKKFLKPDGIIVALLKPHYEAPQSVLVKGVVPEDLVVGIKNQVLREIEKLGFDIKKEIESPILGGGGNLEYLLLITQLTD